MNTWEQIRPDDKNRNRLHVCALVGGIILGNDYITPSFNRMGSRLNDEITESHRVIFEFLNITGLSTVLIMNLKIEKEVFDPNVADLGMIYMIGRIFLRIVKLGRQCERYY